MKNIKNEINKNCNKSFSEIQKAFQNNLISISIKSSHNIPGEYSRTFLSRLGFIRRKIERSSVIVDGNYYMLLSDYRKQKVLIAKGSEEVDLNTLVNEVILELKDYYFNLNKKKNLNLNINELFEIKLVVKQFPKIDEALYTDVHKINKEVNKVLIIDNIKEYIDNLTLNVYKELKESLMYKEIIIIDKKEIKLENFLRDHKELLYLTKTIKGKYSRDDYYKDNKIEKEIINEIERQRAIWYYLKVSERIDIEEKGKRTIKPKVLDGFYSLKEKSEFFYEVTEDQEFKKQLDMIIETDKLIEKIKQG